MQNNEQDTVLTKAYEEPNTMRKRVKNNRENHCGNIHLLASKQANSS